MKVLTIGRDSTNDIIIDDVKISRHQAQLIISNNGKCSIVDLNSTNGTLVNGHRISGEVELSEGDIVQIGNTVLPWQNYARKNSTFRSNKPAESSKSKVWIIIVAVVATIMIVGGGIVAYIFYGYENEEKNSQLSNDSILIEDNSDKDDYIEALEIEIEEREKQKEEQQKKDASKIQKAETELKKAEEAHEKALSERDKSHKNALERKENEIKKVQNEAQKSTRELTDQKQELENENQILNEAIDEQNARIDQLLYKTLDMYLLDLNDEGLKQVSASIAGGVTSKTGVEAKNIIKKKFKEAEVEKKYEIIDVVNFYCQYEYLDKEAKIQVALILGLNATENKIPKDEEIKKKFDSATASVKNEVIAYIEEL